jgi:predicted TIM-barrel fold metal-dependent hydrolase
MTVTSLADIPVIDTDSHVTEPPDLWTARVPAKWADVVPRVDVHPKTGQSTWRIGDDWLLSVGYYARAGWPHLPPHTPAELDEIDPGSWRAKERLERLDEYGIYAQVLYPNVIGFEAPLFMRLDPDVSLACSRAYNDFLVEFASADPARFIPIAMVPFWDRDAAVAEMARSCESGHKGVLFANKYERIGLPVFTDSYWDPIYAAAQEMGLSINFHVGFTANVDGSAKAKIDRMEHFDARRVAMGTTLSMLSNAESIANLVTSGLCDRFPALDFVSVESGFGYITYLLESLDWHWKGYGAHRESPMLPSEYFRRQCYGSFWFEDLTLPLLETYPDNFMFETDYPHPTSLSPGPVSPAARPADHVARTMAKVPLDVANKALYENAARVYHLERS